MSTRLTPQQARACELVADGATITDACAALGVSRPALAHMLDQVPAFASEFARARKLSADALADELLSMRDPEKWPDVQRAKVHADNTKWILARRHRDEYGDRVDVAVNVSVDLGAALRDAKARVVRPICDPSEAVDAEYSEISACCEAGPSDKQSDAPVPAVIAAPSIFD